jgi:hypothetical protein
MTAWRTCNFAVICDAVRKYQRRIVLSVGSASTPVPLAKMDEFSRLGVRPFLPVAR